LKKLVGLTDFALNAVILNTTIYEYTNPRYLKRSTCYR
jgi:hypothetical protein